MDTMRETFIVGWPLQPLHIWNVMVGLSGIHTLIQAFSALFSADGFLCLSGLA